MLGSTCINLRQNVGLQKLSALAGITHSSLGPFKKHKFIQDDASGASTLACSCFRLFENLEPTCAVGQLVHETLRAHQKVYHTGTGCLLFLAGAWSRAALECLQRGISVAHIISAMSEGMEMCLDVCRKSSVPTERLTKEAVVEAPQGSLHLRQTTESDHRTPKGRCRRKIKLSRHFCEAKPDNDSTAQCPDVARIAKGLSHGCIDAMNLAVEASRLQSKANGPNAGCSTFDVAKVVTCVLPGLPEESACVVPGCVVLLPAEQASVVPQLKEQQLNVALIRGDLSYGYRHLGLSRPTGVSRVSDLSDVSRQSKEEEWTEKVVTLLLKLDVKLLLVAGLVGEGVILRLCGHHVLVVEKVKASVLQAFAKATGAVPVTYATQLNRHCVGIGAKAATWRELSSHDGKPLASVNISAGGESELVTVILASCVHAKLQALEDRFWACAYRLHHALQDKVILPGAGVTEMLCVRRLEKQAERHVQGPSEGNGDSVQKAAREPNPYRGVVLHLMADGFMDYISTVLVNTGRFSHVMARNMVMRHLQDCQESAGVSADFSQLLVDTEQDAVSSPVTSGHTLAVNIYDNLSVKQEAWRKALDLVFLVLQADAEVITGVDQMSDGAQENLMLL